MTTDANAQLAILVEALTEIVDMTTAQPGSFAWPSDLLIRVGDVAAGALVAAATYGQLPRFPSTAACDDDAQR
jgi:hypothetical protein